MEFFDSDGSFWLPDRPQRRVPGTLTFDADGLAVQVHDSLHAFEMPERKAVGYSPEWQTVPAVHGRLHGGPPVTLLGVTGISLAGPFGTVTETWRVDFALSGGHITDDLFDQATFDFDALMPWARPPGIVTDGDGPNTVHTDATTVALVETVTGSGSRIQLMSGAVGSWDQNRVHLDQWCHFVTTGDARPIHDVLQDWVRPLQDLLIVCLGRAVRLTSLSVRPSGRKSRDAGLAVSFPAVQPSPRTPPTQAEIHNYGSPTLVTRSDSPIPMENLVATWYDTRERLREAETLLCGPFYAPFIYSEHRYASTFQAAEALARELFKAPDKSAEAHKHRVKAVTKAIADARLGDDVIEWATAILRSRNDKPLAKLIEELTCATGEVGELILDSVPTFPREVARARVGVSHGGALGTDSLRRHWLGVVLSWIVRVQLLVQTGLPLDALVQRTLRKNGLAHAIRELSQSDGSSTSDG